MIKLNPHEINELFQKFPIPNCKIEIPKCEIQFIDLEQWKIELDKQLKEFENES